MNERAGCEAGSFFLETGFNDVGYVGYCLVSNDVGGVDVCDLEDFRSESLPERGGAGNVDVCVVSGVDCLDGTCTF